MVVWLSAVPTDTSVTNTSSIFLYFLTVFPPSLSTALCLTPMSASVRAHRAELCIITIKHRKLINTEVINSCKQDVESTLQRPLHHVCWCIFIMKVRLSGECNQSPVGPAAYKQLHSQFLLRLFLVGAVQEHSPSPKT